MSAPKFLQNRKLVQVRVSPEFEAAVRAAIAREQCSMVEFARRALLAELRRVGIDPAAFREEVGAEDAA